jgi:hypothetical protein
MANAKSSAVAQTSNASRSTVAEMASYSICVLTVFLLPDAKPKRTWTASRSRRIEGWGRWERPRRDYPPISFWGKRVRPSQEACAIATKRFGEPRAPHIEWSIGTGRVASSSNTKMHSRRRFHRIPRVRSQSLVTKLAAEAEKVGQMKSAKAGARYKADVSAASG